MKLNKILLIACSILIANTSFAAIYTWKDATGKVIYSDKPPSVNEKTTTEIGKKDIKVQGKLDSEAVNSNFINKKAEEAKKDGDGKKEADKSKDAAVESPENREKRLKECELAREAARQYDAGGRMTQLNEKGEKEYMSEQAIAAKKDAAMKRAEEICAEPSAKK